MHRQILRLAVPNIISNITVPLLGAVDLAMMGRLDGLIFAGAVSLGAMIFNFMYWAMGFLRMGTAGFTAQAYGVGDEAEQGRILGRGLLLALGGALVLWGLQDLILSGAFWYMEPEPALQTATRSYFKIRIWGAPAAIAAFAFGGWFIGMQNTRIPMWIAIAVNVFNIAFNYLFVFIWDFKADGVAYGTVAAQYLGLGLNLYCLHRFYPGVLRHLRDRAVWQRQAFGRFLNVNKDVFLRTLLIIAVFSFFTAESARYGNTTLVMNTILYEFFIFFSYAVDGFAHAAEALTGRFTGERRPVEAARCVRAIFLWGTTMAVLFSAVYAVAYEPILHLFTKDVSVRTAALPYLPWVLVMTLAGFPAFLWDGVYAGGLRTQAMLYTMLAATAAYFGLYYAARGAWGNHALWAALIAFLICRGGLMTLLYRRWPTGGKPAKEKNRNFAKTDL